MFKPQSRPTGPPPPTPPAEIAVDGLEIHPTGTSRNYEMHNFDISQSVTFNYTILPVKNGTFKIPPQTVRVGSNTYRTPELQLNVMAANSTTAGRGRGNQASPGGQAAGGKIAFAELIVTKKTAYVGEIIPVEVRLGFYSRARGRLVDGPEITGQGFTMQKLQQPDQPRLETMNGRTYEVLTFKTAIAAARAGKFEIGPAQAGAVVAVPRQRQSGGRSRPSSPFDIFSLDDPFSDPFFSDPFGAFGQQERVTIKSEPVTLD